MPSARGLLALAVITAGGLPLAGCGASSKGSDAPAVKAEPPPLTATLVRAEERPWATTVTVQGSLFADEEAVVGAKVAGRIAEVAVDLGTPVKEGDLLARLEVVDFDLRIAMAEAQIEQIRATLGMASENATLDRATALPVREATAKLRESRVNSEQVRDLYRRKAATYLERETAEAALKVAEAQYATALGQVDQMVAEMQLRKAERDLARQARRDAEIRAPFDGVVQRRDVSPGTYVGVGDAVAAVMRINVLRFRGGVPERRSLRVQAGQQVVLQLEGRPEPILAKVTRLTPGLDRANRALTIEADVPNPDHSLRSGLFAEAEIVVGPEDRALALPVAAVASFAGVEKVWRVADDRAAERRIRTGRTAKGFIEVLEGLAPGDSVIAEAQSGRAGPVTPVSEAVGG